LAIKFPPGRRSVLLCDFSAGGFKPPEMIKRRPVIIIVGRLPGRGELATVVPLSTTPPDKHYDYLYELNFSEPFPSPFDGTNICWAKADMLATVSYQRLDLFHGKRDQSGKRKYIVPKITEEQFTAVRNAILNALRFSR
jgi:mRNA interferase MazF